LAPKLSVLVPSTAVLIAETSVQLPTRSRAVWASAAPGREHTATIAATMAMVVARGTKLDIICCSANATLTQH